MIKFLPLLVGIASNVFATYLIKLSISHSSLFSIQLFGVKLEILKIMAVGSYLIAFLSYSKALSTFEVNIAHPIFTFGALIGVLILSVVMFGEKVSIIQSFAYLLFLVGLILLIMSALE